MLARIKLLCPKYLPINVGCAAALNATARGRDASHLEFATFSAAYLGEATCCEYVTLHETGFPIPLLFPMWATSPKALGLAKLDRSQLGSQTIAPL